MIRRFFLAWRYHFVMPSSLADAVDRLRNPRYDPVEPPLGYGGNRPPVLRFAVVTTPIQPFVRGRLDRPEWPVRRRRDAGLSDFALVDDLPGIPGHVVQALRRHGYVTVGDLRRAPRYRIADIPEIRPKILDEKGELGSTTELTPILSSAAINALRDAGYVSVGSIRRASRYELGRVRGVGPATVDALKPSLLEGATFGPTG